MLWANSTYRTKREEAWAREQANVRPVLSRTGGGPAPAAGRARHEASRAADPGPALLKGVDRAAVEEANPGLRAP